MKACWGVEHAFLTSAVDGENCALWSFAICTPRDYTWWAKSHTTLPQKISCFSKKHMRIRKRTQLFVKCWKYQRRSGVYAFALFLMFDANLWKSSSVMLEMNVRIFCFVSSDACRFFLYTFSFEHPYRQKSDGGRCGDRGGHKFQEIMRSRKDSHIINTVEFAVCAVATCYGNQQSCSSTSNTDRKFIISSW
jgi:hypothetical protein